MDVINFLFPLPTGNLFADFPDMVGKDSVLSQEFEVNEERNSFSILWKLCPESYYESVFFTMSKVLASWL